MKANWETWRDARRLESARTRVRCYRVRLAKAKARVVADVTRKKSRSSKWDVIRLERLLLGAEARLAKLEGRAA